jgi:hypothetical protein
MFSKERVLNKSISRTACLVSFGVATSQKNIQISSNVNVAAIIILELDSQLELDEELTC